MASFRKPPMVALFLTLFLSSALLPLVHTRTVEITNFEFENRVPPDNTIIVSASPSGNLSLSNTEFGTIRVVTNELRETAASNSTVLGTVVAVVTLMRDGALYVISDFVYQSRDWNGTIAVQGRWTPQARELEVTGGTGDFRLARGWAFTSLVSDADPASVVIKNVVHLELED